MQIQKKNMSKFTGSLVGGLFLTLMILTITLICELVFLH